MSPHLHLRLFAVALSAALTALLFGCESVESRKSEFNREEGKYYRAYLDGDVKQARQSLERVIELYQSPQVAVLGPRYQAHSLFCAYGRLYVLERRAGDMDDAEVALTKARYWHLQSYESDADWQRTVALHEFLSYQTSDWFEDTMSKLDKGANRGSAPKYIQYLPTTQPNQGAAANSHPPSHAQ